MNNFIPTLKYLWLTTKHKYYVFKGGLLTGAPLWNLIIHDLSKYSIHEAPHYGRAFFGDKSQPEKMGHAWLHHQNNNKHHYEYWIPRSGHGRAGFEQDEVVTLEIPEKYCREMVADWFGASMAYTGVWPPSQDIRDWEWFGSESPKKQFAVMDNETKKKIRKILLEVFLKPETEPKYESIHNYITKIIWNQ